MTKTKAQKARERARRRDEKTVYITPDATQQARAALEDARYREFAKQKSKAVKSLQLNSSRPGGIPHQPVDKLPKAVRDMCPSLRDYARCASRPFTSPAARGMVGIGNVMGSLNSLVVTTTSVGSFGVTASSSVELALYGGHGRVVSGEESIDAQSNHSFSQRIGGTTGTDDYIIGPMPGSAVPRQAIGYVATGLGVNQAQGTTSVATAQPIQNAMALPFTALEGDGLHTRWRLISMGVRVWNVSESSTRTGLVRYVQPSMEFHNTEQTAFSIFSPEWTETAMSNSNAGLEIVWIPRLIDTGYWHNEDHVSANASPGAPAIRIWCVNPSGSAATQLYQYEVVCHWEIAGTNLMQLQGPSPVSVGSHAIINAGISKTRQQSTTGAGFSAMISHVAGQARGIVSMAAKDPRIMSAASAAATGLMKAVPQAVLSGLT